MSLLCQGAAGAALMLDAPGRHPDEAIELVPGAQRLHVAVTEGCLGPLDVVGPDQPVCGVGRLEVVADGRSVPWLSRGCRSMSSS